MDNKELEKIKEGFEKLFVHKGEDGDDPAEKWAWTLRGSFPIEVWVHIEKWLSSAYQQGVKDDRERGRSVLEIIKESADTILFLTSEETTRDNIRNNIIKPIDLFLTSPKEDNE